MSVTPNTWDRLRNAEDGLTERKPEKAGNADFKETLVSFANAVPEGSEAILFVGVADKTREILGCKGIESLQRTIHRICSADCYPPIPYRIESCSIDGKDVLAVIVSHSTQRPHFSGHAFRRVGSQNIKSDETAYADFITARGSVGSVIVANRGKVVSVQGHGKKIGDSRPLELIYREGGQFTIEACDPHTVTLLNIASGLRCVEQIENCSVSRDPSGRLLFIFRDRHRG